MKNAKPVNRRDLPSPAQARVLGVLEAARRRGEIIPSYREIAQKLGMKSVISVDQCVLALLRKGWLQKDACSRARCLRVKARVIG